MGVSSQSPEIILFDGLCNLCQGTMRFIAARDPSKRFKYEFLQSDNGRQLMEKHGLFPEKSADYQTVILVSGNNAYQKSTAMFRILRHLNGLWPLLYIFIIVPRPLRDTLYSFIGKRRYRWFGKRDTCEIPSDEVKQRFLKNL